MIGRDPLYGLVNFDGGGTYSYDVHKDRVQHRAATGSTGFDFDDAIRANTQAAGCHPDLNPFGVTRESRDSDEHPNSHAIAIWFDQTGSMRKLPAIFQDRLGTLLAVLTRRDAIEDPQIMFGAIGDAGNREAAPLQVGQFESDNRMEDHLSKVYLEGNGGGNRRESYELAAYFTYAHTVTDCWEKRGIRGYCFFTGDEMPYETLNPYIVKQIIGDSHLGEPLSRETVFAWLKERYNVFVLMPDGTQYTGDKEIRGVWEGLLGEENVIRLEDPQGIAETIAGIIALCEGQSLADVTADLTAYGVDQRVLTKVAGSLQKLSDSVAVATRVNVGVLPDISGGVGGGIEVLT